MIIGNYDDGEYYLLCFQIDEVVQNVEQFGAITDRPRSFNGDVYYAPAILIC